MFARDQNQVWPSLIDLYEALVLFTEGRLFEARRLCTAAHEFFSTSSMRGKAVLAESSAGTNRLAPIRFDVG